MFKPLFTCLLLSLLFLSTTIAQTKTHLSPEDYGKWQTLAATGLSPNGEWLMYGITVQQDNDTLYVVNKGNNKTYKLEFASGAEFSGDNQWLAYRIGLPFKEAEKLIDASKPIEYKMGLLNVKTGKREEIKNINRFAFS